MCKSEYCLDLFKLRTVQDITNFYWSKCRGFFIAAYFMPFILFNFVPLIVIATIIDSDTMMSNDSSTWVIIALYICTFLFMIGTVINTLSEIFELNKIGASQYLRNAENYYQWIMCFVGIYFLSLLV